MVPSSNDPFKNVLLLELFYNMEIISLLLSVTSGISSVQIMLFDQENFQGRMIEVQNECMNVCDHGIDRVRSIIVETGP